MSYKNRFSALDAHYTQSAHTITVRGRLFDLSSPVVMGILNVTPDSFYADSRTFSEEAIARRADEIVGQGGAILDIGAFSTRPGGEEVTQQEEMRRLRLALAVATRRHPDVIVSVDTFRPDVARMAVEEYGAAMINDVSEGGITGVAGVERREKREEVPAMFRMVAKLGVPYVLMSVKPRLQEMMKSFAEEVGLLHSLGVKDIILDPGFGFGKTLEENYQLLSELDSLQVMGLPLLVGVSRKSMIYRLLGGSPADALNGTTVLHTIALQKGASILRAHDVKAAVEVCRIIKKLTSHY
ncbi:MAG: dihydropteroate synthase [Prevotella sp.]|nr:dihydropteroate synthase [Prevotella sp.]